MSLRTNTGGRQSKTGGKYHLQDTVVKNDNTLLPTNSTLSSKGRYDVIEIKIQIYKTVCLLLANA